MLLAGGCSSLNEARKDKGKGTSRIYKASLDTVWSAVPQAVSDMGLDIAGKSEEDGYVLARKGLSAFSYGEYVAVFVEKVDDERTKVEVVSKKALATNIFAWNWEKPILDRLSEILNSK